MHCLLWVILFNLVGYSLTIATVAIAAMILYRRDRRRFLLPTIRR